MHLISSTGRTALAPRALFDAPPMHGAPADALPMPVAAPLADRAAAALEDAFRRGLLTAASEPTILLDRDARVIAMTEPARSLLRHGDALTIVGDRLHGIAATANDRLRRLIDDASMSGTAPGSIRLPHASARPALIVSVFPIVRGQPGDGARQAAVMVRIVDPIARPSPAVPRWTQAFGFTPREADLAVLLMAGHSAESAAAAMAIRVATARLHLRRLLAKTQTSRQSDLVRLLARI